jgi:hypothetical protein
MPEPPRAVADEFFPGLVGVLSLLEPYLSDVALIGGWVPYLMTSMQRDETWTEPLLTGDIDIAVPRGLRTGGDSIDHEPGAEERVLDVGGGLRVQSLHYTNILLDNTMTVPISKPDGNLLPVRVPTPAAFVFNKGLTFV